MAKKLNKLDLLKLSSIDTASEDFIAFAAKSDGLYQKIGQEENKIATTKELSDKVKTDVPEGAKFTDTIYTAGDNISISGNKISALSGITTQLFSEEVYPDIETL